MQSDSLLKNARHSIFEKKIEGVVDHEGTVF